MRRLVLLLAIGHEPVQLQLQGGEQDLRWTQSSDQREHHKWPWLDRKNDDGSYGCRRGDKKCRAASDAFPCNREGRGHGKTIIPDVPPSSWLNMEVAFDKRSKATRREVSCETDHAAVTWSAAQRTRKGPYKYFGVRTDQVADVHDVFPHQYCFGA